MTDINQIVLAACRAHAPQFDQMDAEIQKYALLQMRSALAVGVTELVKAGRSILDHGGDHDYAAFDAALEPFDELIPYDSTIEADISAAMFAIEELPYECDACTTPGYGYDAQCNCSSRTALCEDEGCDHHGKPHVCNPPPQHADAQTVGDGSAAAAKGNQP